MSVPVPHSAPAPYNAPAYGSVRDDRGSSGPPPGRYGGGGGGGDRREMSPGEPFTSALLIPLSVS